MRPARALARALAGGSAALYAVVDGGRYADLPRLLREHDLRGLPLFLETPRRPAPKAGPHLVALDGASLMRLLDIDDIDRACVFWRTSADEPIVFRHLRGINQARIPLQAETPGRWRADGTESVVFRHWDPDVMALVFPLLDETQRSRLFGPLAQLTLYSRDLASAVQATSSRDWPPAPRGPLTFTPSQMGAIADGMKARSRRKIARYLRKTAEPTTTSMDDATLLDFVAANEAEARGWGLRTEAGFGRFAWLWLATGGKLAQMAPVRSFVAAPGGTPDVRLRQLMRVAAAQAQP